MTTLTIEQVVSGLSAMSAETMAAIDEPRLSKIERDVCDADFKGIAIATPATVDCAKQPGLPVILISKLNALRMWDVDFELNAVAVIVDKERADLYWGHLFPTNKRYDPTTWGSRLGPAPQGPNAEVRATKARLLDLRAACRLPARPGRYAVRVVCFDQASNAVDVAITNSAEKAEEPPAGIAADSAVPFAKYAPSARSDKAFVPRYVAVEHSPSVKGQGVAVTLSDVVDNGERKTMVHGAVRLPAPAEAIVTPRTDQPTPQAAPGTLPGAIVKGTLLLIVRDRQVVEAVKLSVPVWSDHAVKAGDEVEGHFNLDITPYLHEAGSPGDCRLYCAFGAFSHGPVEIAAPKK